MNKTDLIYKFYRYFIMWILRLFYREIILVYYSNFLEKRTSRHLFQSPKSYCRRNGILFSIQIFINFLTRPVRGVTSAKSMKRVGIGHLQASIDISVERVEDALL